MFRTLGIAKEVQEKNLENGLTPDGYYRIPERENEKTIAGLEIGTEVQCSRIIKRCGYQRSPTDMPVDEMNKAAMNLLVSTTGIDRRTVEAVIYSIKAIRSGENPYHIRSVIAGNYNPDKNLSLVSSSAQYQALRELYYIVRGRWLGAKYGNLRTLWYQDVNPKGYILGKVMRQIGKYYSPSGSYDDYEPGGINVQVYQQLYQISRYEQRWAGISLHLVHPLDVEVI